MALGTTLVMTLRRTTVRESHEKLKDALEEAGLTPGRPK